MRLTTKQQQCLDLFEQYPQQWWSVPEVADQMHVGNESAVTTASSLVRHGLLERRKLPGSIVYYRLLQAALDLDARDTPDVLAGYLPVLDAMDAARAAVNLDAAADAASLDTAQHDR